MKTILMQKLQRKIRFIKMRQIFSNECSWEVDFCQKILPSGVLGLWLAKIYKNVLEILKYLNSIFYKSYLTRLQENYDYNLS